MKKLLIILSVLLLVSCGNNNEAATNNPDNTDKPQLEATAVTSLIKVGDTFVELTTFEKYYAMQSYDFEKEYGEAVWNIEKDGKTMTEIRQDQTIDYLIRIILIRDYIDGKNVEVDQAIIDEAYNNYAEAIKSDDERQAYFKDHFIDEAFLKRFIEDQYYLRLFQQEKTDEIANDEAVLSLLFDDQFIRYKARHILVETEDDLNAVLAVLNDEENPVDFSDAARNFSIDSTSAVKGGDLGYLLIGEMPAAFEEMVLTVEPYTVSEVVETEFGYHIIFVDDKQMLQDMIATGMPEDEIEKYKGKIIEGYAADEIVRFFNEMRNAAQPHIEWELLDRE